LVGPLSEAHKRAISESLKKIWARKKGLTLEEIYGQEKAWEMRRKISRALSRRGRKRRGKPPFPTFLTCPDCGAELPRRVTAGGAITNEYPCKSRDCSVIMIRLHWQKGNVVKNEVLRQAFYQFSFSTYATE